MKFNGAIGLGVAGLVFAALLLPPAWATGPSDVDCYAGSVCREKLTGMPLKVLPRPFSNVYKEMSDENTDIVKENVRAFFPLYVYARDDLDTSVPNEPKGWYQVGDSAQGKPLGWMRAKDVLEWKQALIVSYTHPGEGESARNRVLMFQDKAKLQELVESPQRDAEFGNMYSALKKNEVPDGVVSKEPERFVDITKKFYMLPIVDFQMVNIAGDEARYLQLAAAVPGQRSETDTLKNPEFLKESVQVGNILSDRGAAERLGVDLVFVMDMTSSMQPYIDRTKAAIAAIARETSGKSGAKMHFGLVGYRDDVKKMPELGFVSKNFTPELVSAEELAQLLDREAHAATTGSGDYAEEVYAGVKTALESKWTENALRLVVLVGDASSHPVGHPQNTTGLDAKTLRIAADDAQVHMMALHLEEARAAKDHPIAQEQFEMLTRLRGGSGGSVVVVNVEDQNGFQDSVKAATAQVVSLLDSIQQSAVAKGPSGTEPGKGGSAATEPKLPYAVVPEEVLAGKKGDDGELKESVSELPPNEGAVVDAKAPPAAVPSEVADRKEAGSGETQAPKTLATTASVEPKEPGKEDPAKEAGEKMHKLIQAALVEYLGKEQNPPRDVIVWAFDRDPTDPAVRALEVRVLLNKEQLSDLVTKLELITTAMKRSELTQMAFFDALSSVAAGTVKNPDQIKNADKLKGAGLLDAFIESLPYKSDILNLSNEMYAAMTPSERAQLEQSLDAKLALYRVVNEDVDGWVKLNEADEDAQKVYPLNLDALP